ncbi:hypothetical protein [Falsigemmobacter faecalis]|uniref:Uncharacterized protein n=1 Tax=Falsigemmobacter faecalis TaxID=2488730 RepID=A0A3P3D9N5_9RHOB|nr:hypothetical protein [Falsigemmobacter faecalis]RRH71070.1 hypothetical protein EG244_16870 [Falsigemmobacter faecalis]
MDMTTCSLLRRITQTDLTMAAHKLATLILDRMAWKEGYNGLPKGAAGFTMAELSEAMGVSRQYLYQLFAELEASELKLSRERVGAGGTLWLFRFGIMSETDGPGPTTRGDRALYKEETNKTFFTGMIEIEIEAESGVQGTGNWLERIAAVKEKLPCKGLDSRHIWERFLAFNQARGHLRVPAGWLLGFMRKWRVRPEAARSEPAEKVPSLPSRQLELQKLIAKASVANRGFVERELRQAWGDQGYEQRVREMAARFGCGLFSAALAVHGAAGAMAVP